jgi:hypothetical protein
MFNTSKNNNATCCPNCENYKFSIHATKNVIRSICLTCGFLYELQIIEKYIYIPKYISDPRASCVPVRKPVFIKKMIRKIITTRIWVHIGIIDKCQNLYNFL